MRRTRSEAGRHRIAVIGCGAIAADGHLPALAAHGLAPSVVVDPDPARRALSAADWGGDPVASVAEALERCDAAIVAVPHHRHVEVCGTLLEAGVHVLLEKPLATTAADAATLVSA